MELLLKREKQTRRSTMGSLFFDGKFECFTLEDIEREVKIKEETAIPKGRYQVVVTMSTRFKKMLPLLLNVPNYEGVRIHSGNTDADSSGCILVGQTKSVDFIGNSRAAMSVLLPKIEKALKTEKVFITIE